MRCADDGWVVELLSRGAVRINIARDGPPLPVPLCRPQHRYCRKRFARGVIAGWQAARTGCEEGWLVEGEGGEGEDAPAPPC